MNNKPIYTVLIAEANRIQRQIMTEYCNQAGLQVIGTTGCGSRLVQLAVQLRPDLVLLDIDLHKLDGINAYRRLRHSGIYPQVILVTHSKRSEHLLTSINEFHCAGYLLKPLHIDEFQASVNQAIRWIEQNRLLPGLTVGLPNWIKARFNKRDYFFNEDSIVFIEKESKRTLIVYLINGQSYRLTSTLQEMKQQSNGSLFCPHRAFLVNMNHIETIIPDNTVKGNYQLVMKNHAVIPLTRRCYTSTLWVRR